MEVMAAVVVISIMSLTAVYLVKNTSTEFIQVKTTRHAYELAQEKLFQIVDKGNLSSYSGSAGTFGDDEDYVWSSEVITTRTDGVKILIVDVENKTNKAKASLNYMFLSS